MLEDQKSLASMLDGWTTNTHALDPSRVAESARPESNFETSRFLGRKFVDPKSLQPPQSITMRDKAEKLRNDLLFPKSPAFVNNFRNVKKDVELTQLA